MANQKETKIANSTPQFGRMGRNLDDLSTPKGDEVESCIRPMQGKCLHDAFAKEPVLHNTSFASSDGKAGDIAGAALQKFDRIELLLNDSGHDMTSFKEVPPRTPSQTQKASSSAPSSSPPKRPVAGLNTLCSDARLRGGDIKKIVTRSSRRNSPDKDSNLVSHLKQEVHSKEKEISELRRLCEAQANELHQFRSESIAETASLKGRMMVLERLLEQSGERSPSPARIPPSQRSWSPPRDGFEEIERPREASAFTDAASSSDQLRPLSSLLDAKGDRNREKSPEGKKFAPNSRRRNTSTDVAENRAGLHRSPSNTSPRAPIVASSLGKSSPTRQSMRSNGIEVRVLQRSMSSTATSLQALGGCATTSAAHRRSLLSPRAGNMSSTCTLASSSLPVETWPKAISASGGRIPPIVARPFSPSESLSSCPVARTSMLATAGSPRAYAPIVAVSVQGRSGCQNATHLNINAAPLSPRVAYCG